jgi:hypothetical protein
MIWDIGQVLVENFYLAHIHPPPSGRQSSPSESQCISRFGRNQRLHDEHLKYTLNQSKSGGDHI